MGPLTYRITHSKKPASVYMYTYRRGALLLGAHSQSRLRVKWMDWGFSGGERASKGAAPVHWSTLVWGTTECGAPRKMGMGSRRGPH